MIIAEVPRLPCSGASMRRRAGDRGTRIEPMADQPSATSADALNVTIELGRAQVKLAEANKLEAGAIVPLDKLAGDPVDVVAAGRVVARGEVVVIDKKFCVRVVEIVATEAA